MYGLSYVNVDQLACQYQIFIKTLQAYESWTFVMHHWKLMLYHYEKLQIYQQTTSDLHCSFIGHDDCLGLICWLVRTQKKAKFCPFPRSINCISITWMDYDTLTWWYNVLIWVMFNGWLIWTLSYEDFVMKVLSLAIHNITRDACNGWRLESKCDALVMCTIRMCGLIVGTLNCTNKQFWLLDHIGNHLIHLTIAKSQGFSNSSLKIRIQMQKLQGNFFCFQFLQSYRSSQLC